MKKTLISFLLAVIILFSFVGCTDKVQPTNAPETANKERAASSSPAESVQSQARTITDLGGNVVEIPPSSEIKHVVVITPPVTSVLLEVIPDNTMIVGLNPKAFSFSNAAAMASYFQTIKILKLHSLVTTFQSILKLSYNSIPTLFFIMAKVRKKGLKILIFPSLTSFRPN